SDSRASVHSPWSSLRPVRDGLNDTDQTFLTSLRNDTEPANAPPDPMASSVTSRPSVLSEEEVTDPDDDNPSIRPDANVDEYEKPFRTTNKTEAQLAVVRSSLLLSTSVGKLPTCNVFVRRCVSHDQETSCSPGREPAKTQP